MKLCYRHHLSDASTWPPNSITWGQSGFGWLDISNHGAVPAMYAMVSIGGERITGAKTELFLRFLSIFVQCLCALVWEMTLAGWILFFFGWVKSPQKCDAGLPPAAVHHAALKSPPSNQNVQIFYQFQALFFWVIRFRYHLFASFGRIYWQTILDCHIFKLQSNIFQQLKNIWNEPMLAEQHYFAWRALFVNADGCMYILELTYGRMVSSKARRYCPKCIPPIWKFSLSHESLQFRFANKQNITKLKTC